MCCVVQLPPRALHHLHANAPHVPLASLVIVVVTVIKYVTTAKALLSCNVWQQRWHFYYYLPVFVFFYLIFFFDTMLPLFYYSFFPISFFVCFFCLNNCATLIVFRYASLPCCLVCLVVQTLTHAGIYIHIHTCLCMCAYQLL